MTFSVSGVAQQESGAGVRGPASLRGPVGTPVGATAQRLPESLSRRSPGLDDPAVRSPAVPPGLFSGRAMQKAWGTPQGVGPSTGAIAQELLGQVSPAGLKSLESLGAEAGVSGVVEEEGGGEGRSGAGREDVGGSVSRGGQAPSGGIRSSSEREGGGEAGGNDFLPGGGSGRNSMSEEEDLTWNA